MLRSSDPAAVATVVDEDVDAAEEAIGEAIEEVTGVAVGEGLVEEAAGVVIIALTVDEVELQLRSTSMINRRSLRCRKPRIMTENDYTVRWCSEETVPGCYSVNPWAIAAASRSSA